MKGLLQDWLSYHAEYQPDAVAVAMKREKITYGRLERYSNQLAQVLKAIGCERGDRVCLLMPKSPAAILGILGILKTGCIYVPIDISSPPLRIAKMLDSCECRVVLAAGPVIELLNDLWRQERFRKSIIIGWLDMGRPAGENFQVEFTLVDIQKYLDMPLTYQNAQTDPAYILFTSGSTGTPKGVVITHSNVIHFIKWAVEYFRMDATDKIASHTPLHFDLSVFDLFGSLAAGAQLHLIPQELILLPHKLVELIRSSGLTHWLSVPSILNYLQKFDVVRQDDFPDLRRLIWCGEVFATSSLIYWMKRLPHVRFTNLYGPTETTVASSYFTVRACPEDEKTQIPIGTPCEGEELLILDERWEPLPPGRIGDLYIRGVGLSPGYWKDPDRTREVFFSNPHSSDPSDRIYKTGDLASIGENSLIYFHGRADDQIKSRGFRIELGEIEAALNSLGLLSECAVVAITTDDFEGAIICCAYAASPGVKISLADLHKELGKILPSYMLPSQWMAFDELPKNINGKIDRRALKEGFSKHEAPANRKPGDDPPRRGMVLST